MSKQLKVALINHSDTLGGAAVVTYRLKSALRRAGVDARMVVYTKGSDSPNVYQFSSRFLRGLKFMWECFAVARANGWNRENLFTVSLGAAGYNLASHPWVKEADVIVLNWVNQGMLSLGDIRRILKLGKPVIWTMHDMWPLTGVCHQAKDCEGYLYNCGYCPLLHNGKKANDASTRVMEKKRRLYERHKITFVAVSHWLQDKCRQSTLLRDQDVRVIPNAFPTDFFITKPSHQVQNFELDYSKKLIVMGAARLDDPIKGLDYAIEALNKLFDMSPELANTSTAVFFGDIRNPGAFRNLRFPHRYIGRINDPKLLRQLYASSAVVMSSSLCETLPGTLIEGLGAGCVPVTFGEGGQDDIIDHLKTGYIARLKDTDDLANGLKWALENPLDRDMLHQSVHERFNADAVAQSYIALFNDLLNQ